MNHITCIHTTKNNTNTAIITHIKSIVSNRSMHMFNTGRGINKILSGKLFVIPRMLIKRIPKEWYIWYRTAVSKIPRSSDDTLVFKPWAPNAPIKTLSAANIAPIIIHSRI